MKQRGRPKLDPHAQRAGETNLQWQARLAAQRDYEASKLQTPVTPEAARHGDYEQAYTEVDGQRRQVLINRGGSAIQRWMNAPPDDVLGDHERAAIRYCQGLWNILDRRGQRMFRVDAANDGIAQHEALAELSALKIKLPLRHWSLFENVCRFDASASTRGDRVMVAFVAGMIAMWRRL